MNEPKIPCPVCYPATIPTWRPNPLHCEGCRGETYLPASVLDRELTAMELHCVMQAHLQSDYPEQDVVARFRFVHHLNRHVAERMREEGLEFNLTIGTGMASALYRVGVDMAAPGSDRSVCCKWPGCDCAERCADAQ